MTPLEQALQFIETLQIADYFALMKAQIGNDVAIAQLEKTFILGKTDVDFYERLKALANLLLADTAGKANSNTANKGTIIQNAEKIYNIGQINNANIS